MTQTTRTTCPYCGVGCGVLATPDANGGATIAGDSDHPANFGRLCSKGTALGQTLGLDGRLLTPQIGGAQASWDTALDLVAGRFSQAIDQHGPDSVAFYVSGQFLTEDYYVANKLMKGFIGSANIDTNSRLCMASSVAGHKRAFGSDTVPGTYEDLDQADLVVLVGSNLAWCHPVLHQRVMTARASRGTKLVTIDPRRTATADTADLHLNLRPGSDTALFGGLLRRIFQRAAQEPVWIADHVDGADAALAATADLPEISRLTGLSPDQLTAFYDLWIDTPRVVTVYSQGVNQASDGTDKVNAILNCHLATGRIGRPGCGPFSVTGQPNAMGGREVGGLANMLANHLDIANPTHRSLVQDFWNAPHMPTAPGLRAVDLFDACAKGQIKALWIMCTNPAVSLPSARNVAQAIRTCPFVVVSDIVAQTDTTKLANVLLPATGWGEKNGTVTNSERRISRQRRFLPAPGQARDDWRILCDVAGRMGFAGGFDFETAAEIFDEYARLSALAAAEGANLNLSGLIGLLPPDYDALAPVQWPVTKDRAGGRLFADGQFNTRTRKAHMVPVTPRPSPNQATGDLPYTLNTGRIRDHWHTMTRTGTSETLSQHLAEPFAEIHPTAARAEGIEDATLVRVENGFGHLIARARLTDRVSPGQVFVPMHWTGEWAANGLANATTSRVTDPVSGQPELKRTAVRVSPVKPTWYGFAISRSEPAPDTLYWAKARILEGWQVELAGTARPADWPAYARALLKTGTGDLISAMDLKAGRIRLVFVRDGRLEAAFFAAPEPVAAARAYLSSALSDEGAAAESFLAGVAGRDRPDPGPTVCSCFSVGLNTIRMAVADGQAVTVDQIGTLLQAGTNCGSCRPEIQTIITAMGTPLAAE